MRTLANGTGFLFGVALAALLLLAMLPRAHATAPASDDPPVSAAESATDLPREQPKTATGFVYCDPGTGKRLIVAVVVTYPSGKLVRFDKNQMHGLASVTELVKYADSAADTAIYGSGMCTATAT